MSFVSPTIFVTCSNDMNWQQSRLTSSSENVRRWLPIYTYLYHKMCKLIYRKGMRQNVLGAFKISISLLVTRRFDSFRIRKNFNPKISQLTNMELKL